jgi:hypothetical protein
MALDLRDIDFTMPQSIIGWTERSNERKGKWRTKGKRKWEEAAAAETGA